MSTQAHWFSLSALATRKSRSASKTALGIGASSTFGVFARWLNPFSALLIAYALLLQLQTFYVSGPSPTCKLGLLSDLSAG